MINDLIQNFIQAMKNEGYNVEVVISKKKKEVPQIKVGDFVKAWRSTHHIQPIYGTVSVIHDGYVHILGGGTFDCYELSKKPCDV
jgi:hypothetical protein